MLRRVILRALAIPVLGLALAGPVQAQVGADLNISPKRVVFDAGARSAVVYVFNQGDQEAAYSVSLVDRAMLPTGEIVDAADHPEVPVDSAAELVQFAPRRIVLGPRESQAIRVRVRPAADGRPEHRTHLTVTAIPADDVGFTVDQAAQAADDGLAIRIVALFSLSIPLIVREGDVDARLALEAPVVEPSGAGVTVDLARLGTHSTYGDLEVRAMRDGREMVVGLVRGVAVYHETPRRRVLVPLSQALVAGETLRVVYRDGDARPDVETAQASLRVP